MAKKPKRWERTGVANLWKLGSTGMYYARVKVTGKYHWKSLKTKTSSVAKLRLADFERAIRKRAGLGTTSAKSDKLNTLGQVIDFYVADFNVRDKSPGSVKRMARNVKTFRKTWPSVDSTNIRNLTEQQCLQWAASLRNGEFSEVGREGRVAISTYNKLVSLLKNSLALAVRQGVIFANPMEHVTGLTPKNKELVLPTAEQFRQLVATIRKSPSRMAGPGADMVEFMAYTGTRISEAAAARWEDVDEAHDTMRIRGTKTAGSFRYIPLFSNLKDLLGRLGAKRGPASSPSDSILRYKECRGSLDSACKTCGLTRLTHHSLRHLFATRCIESGVDIPTVSRWLGHVDGGVLALRTYGHLRKDHSHSQAAKVVW